MFNKKYAKCMKQIISKHEFTYYYPPKSKLHELLTFYSISGVDKIGGFKEEYYYLKCEGYYDDELVQEDLFVTPSYNEAINKIKAFIDGCGLDTGISNLFQMYKH